MSSKVLVDELAGKTAAGNITITSEGGAATMQLQQGLTKQFLMMNADQVPNDSLNTSSVTDSATGDFTVNFSNNFSNSIGIALSGAAAFARVTLTYGPGTEPNTTTSTIRCATTYASGTNYVYYDNYETSVLCSGDLA